MPTKTYQNVQMCYITNYPHTYVTQGLESMTPGTEINTGWHVWPNQLFAHYLSPKQWYDLMESSNTWTPTHCSIEIFNMIPQTEQLAIQGTSTIWGFNNCLYAMLYEDDIHETNTYNWMKWETDVKDKRHILNTTPNLMYKEGRQNFQNAEWVAQYPPIYSYQTPLFRTKSNKTWSANSAYVGDGLYPEEKIPGGICWDPLCRPEQIMELRPGKNAVKFEWHLPPQIPVNSDALQYTYPYSAPGPYQGNQRPGGFQQTLECNPDELCSRNEATTPYNDYTMPDYYNQPVVQTGLIWNQLDKSLIMGEQHKLHKPNVIAPGLEIEKCLEGIPQLFCKILPIFKSTAGTGASPTLVPCVAQVSYRTSITFQTTERKSAIYAPTTGPFGAWVKYSHLKRDYNYRQNYIRAKNSGFVRSWQNVEFHTAANLDSVYGAGAYHPREDPYKESVNVTSGSGQGGTYTLTTTIAKQDPDGQTQPTPSKRKWYSRLRDDLAKCAGKEQHINEAYEEDEDDAM